MAGRASERGGRELSGVAPRRAAGINFGDASIARLPLRPDVTASHAAVAAAISAGVLLMDRGVGAAAGVPMLAGVRGGRLASDGRTGVVATDMETSSVETVVVMLASAASSSLRWRFC